MTSALPEGVVLRRLRDDDPVPALTDLLHRAYAPLAARGLRYVATHQDDRTTRHRCSQGECWVAELGGRVVATVTLVHGRTSECAYYARPGVARFGQFAVEPSLQGRGVGRALVELCERRAREDGCTEIACDTSEHAAELIAMYERWGYVLAGRTRWKDVNYESVVLAKAL